MLSIGWRLLGVSYRVCARVCVFWDDWDGVLGDLGCERASGRAWVWRMIGVVTEYTGWDGLGFEGLSHDGMRVHLEDLDWSGGLQTSDRTTDPYMIQASPAGSR